MTQDSLSTRWPKKLPTLNAEQQRIREDFYNIWLTELPRRYGLVELFNHRYPLRTAAQGSKTLDIGAGRGEHLEHENLNNQEYIALELRPELAAVIRTKHPAAQVVIGDIQKRMELADGYFNRILAIHVLEHLPDLPRALDEIKRILHPDGTFSVMIPCDPGFAYSIARNISARRLFEQRYKQSYNWFIACEHINRPDEILVELRSRFAIKHRFFFPLLVPMINPNLIIGLTSTHLR